MSTIAHFTLAEYDRMIEAGVFEPKEEHRVELIRGEIREMSPIKPPHEYILDRLTVWSFDVRPRDRVWVRSQNSVGLPQLDSAPQPDLFWVRNRSYRTQRPTASDVFLMIEVADSSLDYDRTEKASLYAEAGIQDYWIVNVPDGVVEVYRQPSGGRYRQMQTFSVGESISPLAFPEIELAVAYLWSDE